MIFVYCITGPGGKRYIGISRRPSRRARNHRHLAKTGAKQNHPLYRAMRKYGPEQFALSILGAYEDIDAARAAEIAAIVAMSTLAPAGYNLSKGGNYDGAEGGRALATRVLGDDAFRLSRSEIGRRSVHHAHKKMIAARRLRELREEAEALERSVRAWKKCPARDAAEARLRSVRQEIEAGSGERHENGVSHLLPEVGDGGKKSASNRLESLA